MDNSANGFTIHILDKEYMISCSEEERHDLQRSADYLDKKMREIRDSGKIVGSDRIAVMAALNISHELLASDNAPATADPAIGNRIQSIQEKIDEALFRAREV